MSQNATQAKYYKILVAYFSRLILNLKYKNISNLLQIMKSPKSNLKVSISSLGKVTPVTVRKFTFNPFNKGIESELSKPTGIIAPHLLDKSRIIKPNSNHIFINQDKETKRDLQFAIFLNPTLNQAKKEIQELRKTIQAIKNLNISQDLQNKITEETAAQSAPNLINPIIRSISMMISPMIKSDEFWEIEITNRLLKKYQFCAKIDNYDEIIELFKSILQVFFYNCYDQDFQLRDLKIRRDKAENIKNICNLESDINTVKTKLDGIYLAQKNPDSILKKISQYFIKSALYSICPKNSHDHLEGWVGYLITAKNSDKNIFTPASFMTMEDVRRTLEILTFRSANITVEIYANHIENIIEKTQQNIAREPLPEAKLREKFEKILKDETFDAIKTRFKEDIFDLALQQSKEKIRDEAHKIAVAIVEEPQILQIKKEALHDFCNPQTLNLVNIILLFNTYAAKNLKIPLWLRDKAYMLLSGKIVKDFYEIEDEIFTDSIEDEIATKLNEAAKNIAQDLKIPLKLLNPSISFWREYAEIDPDGTSQYSIANLLNAGARFETIEHHFQEIAKIENYHEEISLTGILFHPQQEEILNFITTQSEISRSKNPDLPILDSSNDNLQQTIDQALMLGDINLIRKISHYFIEKTDKIPYLPKCWLEGTLTPPQLELPQLDILLRTLSQSLPRSEISNIRKIFASILNATYPSGQDYKISFFAKFLHEHRDKKKLFEWVQSNFGAEFLLDLMNSSQTHIEILAQIASNPKHKKQTYEALEYIEKTQDPIVKNKLSDLYFTVSKILETYNPQESFDFTLKAAKGGVAQAQEIIGYCYMTGHKVEQDMDEAFKFNMESYKNGLRNLNLEYLGLHYANGEGVEQSLATANKFFLEAKYYYQEKLSQAKSSSETAKYNEKIATMNNYIKTINDNIVAKRNNH